VGGNFININSGGIFISGNMVMINSGGSAGSGAGSSPTAPQDPAQVQPGAPTLLAAAPPAPAAAGPGDFSASASMMDQSADDAPAFDDSPSPGADMMAQASDDGTPMCAVCPYCQQQGDSSQQQTDSSSQDQDSSSQQQMSNSSQEQNYCSPDQPDDGSQPQPDAGSQTQTDASAMQQQQQQDQMQQWKIQQDSQTKIFNTHKTRPQTKRRRRTRASINGTSLYEVSSCGDTHERGNMDKIVEAISPILFKDDGTAVFAVLDGGSIPGLLEKLHAVPRLEFVCSTRRDQAGVGQGGAVSGPAGA